MMQGRYDVIVVGARVAGAATAMQLAQRGLDVLVVDRAAPGADTLSTHALLGPGVELLDRWGLVRPLYDSGTPAIEATTFHYEGLALPFDLSERPLMAPRRTVIDRLLAANAAAAGADVRYGCRVTELVRNCCGDVVGVTLATSTGLTTVTARLVIGADGIGSFVARNVGAEVTHQSAHPSAAAFAYFEGLPFDGYNWFYSRRAGAGLIPTNDGLTCVFASGSSGRFADEVRADVGAGFSRLLAEAAPNLAEAWPDARRVSRFRTFPGRRGFTRRSHGPGWALVGDAGAFTDPMSAHGMTAALRDSVLCADAATQALDDRSDEPWHRYERLRDALTIPFIDAVDDVAAFRQDMDRVQRAHIAMSRAGAAETATLERLGWGIVSKAGSHV